MYLVVLLWSCIATTEGFIRGNRVMVTLASERRDASIRMSSKFDLDVARSIAGFAFDVYNEPPLGKVATGRDETTIIFTSSEFIKQMFSGVVMVNLLRAEFREDNSNEKDLIESLISGPKADPYVRVEMMEGAHKANPDENLGEAKRVVDTVRSNTRLNTARPVFNETYFLYAMDASQAKIRFSVWDKDILQEDDNMGNGEVLLTQVIKSSNDVKARVKELPIPLFLPVAKQGGLLSAVVPFFKAKRRRTGTLYAELTYIPLDSINRVPAGSRSSIRLEGASSGVSWGSLVPSPTPSLSDSFSIYKQPKQELSAAFQHDLTQVCSIDNQKTDTQGRIWVDRETRQVVISFRGTEQTVTKDILTDINLIQAPFFNLDKEEDSDEEEKRRTAKGFTGSSASISEALLREARVHAGFLTAYRSVQQALLQVLRTILVGIVEEGDQERPPFRVYITGHSLGGALATLLTFDLGRMQAGLWGASAAVDTALEYRDDTVFMRALATIRLDKYSFGAPRVGNPAFAALYDTVVQHSFRMVNGLDIVPRMPRTGAANAFLQYSHAGRTVFISSEGEGGAESGYSGSVEDLLKRGPLWIEGESEGACPLSEISPLMKTDADDFTERASDLQRGRSEVEALLMSVGSKTRSAIESLMADPTCMSVKNMQEMAAATTAEASSQLQDIWSDLAKDDATGLALAALANAVQSSPLANMGEYAGGMNSGFVQQEVLLWRSIVDGQAIDHHLEPSYFKALRRATALVENDAASLVESDAASRGESASGAADGSARGEER